MPEVVMQPWPWYVAGPLIGLVVPFVYWYGGKEWGVSSTLRHLCAATVPARIEYFQYDWWKKGALHLAMASGMLLGGFIGGRVLSGPDDVVGISEATRSDLAGLGVTDFTGMVPDDVFALAVLFAVPGIVIILLGGFLVGFGARYANGCTSGHAISGLANLQASSLVAVISFFIGGLISAHVLIPWLLE